MHEQLVHEARRDSLTGLPNRSVAEDRLEQAQAALSATPKDSRWSALISNGFKTINDDLGHDVGDVVLRAVALRLPRRIRHYFGAEMNSGPFWKIAQEWRPLKWRPQAMITALEEPVSFDGRNLKISASMGLALYPSDRANATQLKRPADQECILPKGTAAIKFRSGRVNR